MTEAEMKERIAELERTIKLVSEVFFMGVPTSAFGNMSPIELIQKRPDIAVNAINGVLARNGFQWIAGPYELVARIRQLQAQDAVKTRALEIIANGTGGYTDDDEIARQALNTG